MELPWIYTCSECGYKAENRKDLDGHWKVPEHLDYITNEHLFNYAVEAKDRLNRLMLTRERERLEKLKENRYVNSNSDGSINTLVIDVADIDDEIKAIDAQLNKEEK